MDQVRMISNVTSSNHVYKFDFLPCQALIVSKLVVISHSNVPVGDYIQCQLVICASYWKLTVEKLKLEYEVLVNFGDFEFGGKRKCCFELEVSLFS